MLNKKFHLNRRVLFTFIILTLFLIISFSYIGKTKMSVNVKVTFEYSSKIPVYIVSHYKNNKKNELKKHYLVESNGFNKVSFYLDKNEYKNLFFYFQKVDKKVSKNDKSMISIRRLIVENTFNSISLKGGRLFNSIKKVKTSNGLLKVDGVIRVCPPFMISNSKLNKQIKKLSEEKTIYYFLLIPISVLLYFLISSIRLPVFYVLKKYSLLQFMFIVLIFIPIIYGLIRSTDNYKICEKSKKSKKNVIKFKLYDLKDTYKQFMDVYKLNFFYRAKMIRYNNLVKTRIFRTSPLDKVVFGKKEWLFYAKEDKKTNVIDYYRATKPFTIEDLRYWKKLLEERYYWLRKKNIAYIFLLVPNKSTVYPELLPSNIRKTKKKNRLDQLIDYLKLTKSPVKILDLRDEFNKKKKEYKMYRRTDSHWSYYGAFFGYRMIMKSLRENGISSFSVSLENYKFIKINNAIGGDLSRLLSLQKYFREDRIMLMPKIKRKIFDRRLKYYNKPFVKIRVKESQCGDIGTTIFIHDSFGNHLKRFLPQHFKRIVFIRDWGLNFYTKIIKKENPVVVIDEMAERFLMSKKPVNPVELR